MWIRSGDVEIRALGAYAEHAYQSGTSRRVMRMRLLDVPTPEQLDALCAGPIMLSDNAGSVIATHEGFNAVYECHLTLGVYGPEELAYLVEQARADSAERELAELKATLAALQATQPAPPDPVTSEGGVS